MFDTGVVTTPGLNLRERPGGKVIDILALGDRVVILARAQPGKKLWYYIRPETGRSRRGYVLASDVAVDPRPAGAEVETAGARSEPRADASAPPRPGKPSSRGDMAWFAAAALALAIAAILLAISP